MSYGRYGDPSNGANREERYFIRKAKEYSIKGKHLEAIKFYQEARSILNNHHVLADIAREYEAIEDYNRAMEYWDKMYMWCNTNRNALEGKADLLYRLGKYGEAITFYKKSLKAMDEDHRNPVDISGLYLDISDCYKALGKYDRARKYENCSKQVINAFANEKMKIAERYNGNGNFKTAKRFYGMVLKYQPNNTKAKKRFEECEKILNMDEETQMRYKKEAIKRTNGGKKAKKRRLFF